MRFVVLDFETKDPMIGLDLGAGYPFAINYPYASLFYPIGYSYCIYDSEDGSITKSEYFALGTKDLNQSICSEQCGLLNELIKSTQNIVMHNAQYDLGCLLALGISIDHLRVYDTMVMAKLNDSTLWAYSLSSLLKKYSLGTKLSGSLGDVVDRFDLIKTPKGNSPNKETKTYVKRCTDFAYANMNLIQELDFTTMARYANADTEGTAALFKYLYQRVGDKLSHFYSNIQKICVGIRSRGITVDMDNVNIAIEALSPVLLATEKDLYRAFGREFNLRSTDQLPAAMLELGYKLPTTDAGNYSVNKEFLEENPNDPVCQTIRKFRTVDILLNHFAIKTKDMQQYSCPDVQGGSKYGRVFPELNLLEARTGRFSSSNPNIQNIPKRDKDFAKLCRAMFTCTDRSNNWYSLDWSNQEGRLQLHYAVLKNFTESKTWLKRFLENPKIDTHSIVAEMMGGVDRNIAKTIYLGKSFCMGRAKTAKRLGLPTAMIETSHGKMESSGPEATKLIEKYEKAFPYLTELQKDCMEVIQDPDRGYIKTIGGRSCKRPPQIKGRNFDYKAISLLIQGSAADQMYHALTMAHDAGIDVLSIVHDEFNVEGRDNAIKMKEIMESSSIGGVELKVPMVVNCQSGTNWGDLSDDNLSSEVVSKK